MGKKVFFLDRDGVMNVDHGYVNEAEQFEWCEGVFEALKILQARGFTLAIVTNQSGVGAGMYTLEDMQALHDRMLNELEGEGITIAKIAYCADSRESTSECRKPNTGMAKEIEKEVGEIDYEASWMIGDKPTDMQFGKSLGTRTALVRSRYWTEDELEAMPDYMVDSLLDLTKQLYD